MFGWNEITLEDATSIKNLILGETGTPVLKLFYSTITNTSDLTKEKKLDFSKPFTVDVKVGGGVARFRHVFKKPKLKINVHGSEVEFTLQISVDIREDEHVGKHNVGNHKTFGVYEVKVPFDKLSFK